VQQFITTYGYLAIFVLMLAESACVPVPSELIMTFGGALAAGAVPGTSLNLIGVILAGTAGNVAGSYIAWAAGRYLGLPALSRITSGRWGRRLRFRERDLDRAVAWFGRYGGKAVLIGRVLPVVRTFISLPAGIAGMAPVRFGVYTTVGCIPWTAALAVAGYAVGANWKSIVSAFHGPTYIIAGVVVLVIVVGLWRYWRRRPAAEPTGSADAAGSAEAAGPAEAGSSADAAISGSSAEPVSPADAENSAELAASQRGRHSSPGAHRRLPQALREARSSREGRAPRDTGRSG
jgi:membrane protein DedA with SNARE-associated domain